MRLRLIARIVLGLIALCTAPTALAALFRITDLGALSGNESEATDVNDNGEVVGVSKIDEGDNNPDDDANHAFRWSNGIITDLGTLGGSRSFAYGINEAGHVAGSADLANDEAGHAFLTTDGMKVDLGVLAGNNSLARAVNELDQVVGLTTNAVSNNQHAFIWDSVGGMIDLGTLGGSFSQAHDINDLGQVVGESESAFLWEKGNMVPLDSLGGPAAQALAINNSGQIVGAASLASGAFHAALWGGDTVTDLQTLPGDVVSIAFDVNEAGDAVGISSSSTIGLGRAVLWRGGQIIDLTTALDSSGAGWLPYSAEAINNHGWIVGVGINPDGDTHGFLLTPLPEPSSLSVLATAALTIASCRRGGRMRRSEWGAGS